MKLGSGMWLAATGLALGLGPVAAAAATPKKILTHEILWMMKRVGAPIVSPDGKWVVYALAEPSYDRDGAVSDLWIVAADGTAPPRRLTDSKAAEATPAWAPDSRRIAFSTKREGDDEAQIYVIDIAGGEARRVTGVTTGAANPKWRPDGEAILFESAVYPGATDDASNKQAAADRKARKYNMRVYNHFPVRYWNQWIDDRRPSLWLQPLVRRRGGARYPDTDQIGAGRRVRRQCAGRWRHHAGTGVEPRRPRNRLHCNHRALERGLFACGLSPLPDARYGR